MMDTKAAAEQKAAIEARAAEQLAYLRGQAGGSIEVSMNGLTAPTVIGTVGSVFARSAQIAPGQLSERVQAAYLREMEYLAEGGDNARGQEEWKRIMRRFGRYRGRR